MAAEMETRLRDSVWNLSVDQLSNFYVNPKNKIRRHKIVFIYIHFKSNLSECGHLFAQVLRVLRPTLAQVSELDLKQQDQPTGQDGESEGMWGPFHDTI